MTAEQEPYRFLRRSQRVFHHNTCLHLDFAGHNTAGRILLRHHFGGGAVLVCKGGIIVALFRIAARFLNINDGAHLTSGRVR